MLKSVLVHIHDDSGLDGRIAAALDICRAHDAHLTCMHVTPYGAYAAFDPAGGMFVSGVLVADLRKQQDALQQRIEARMSAEDVRWDWKAFDGDVAQTLVSASSLADLLVLGQAGPPKGDVVHPLPIVDGVVVHAGCPVLVVPAGCNRIDPTAPAVIGWNASEQAARAIRQALPTLTMASEAHLVSIGKQEEEFPQLGASEYLSRHGISSELHLIDPGVREPDDVLHQFALDQGAGCLLIGAYGHSRLRETLLGGVTRYLTMQSRVPLMLAR
jgi:nucleotide-binding universal stress UspA family protein